ncbi:unnamed protein product [Trichobilharzia regenti]|nr:unnamed protein product [Trichobilharzia regenti]
MTIEDPDLEAGKRTLNDIDNEVKKCERKEEKSKGMFCVFLIKNKALKPREKAKEEAMKLLKSGAISIENKNERHTFKRKPKVSRLTIEINTFV